MTSSTAPTGPGEGKAGRTVRRDLVQAKIYDQAARLFAERGFAATTPQDIADAVGISRQSLYYYIKSKEEILARLVADISVQILHDASEIAARPLDPPAALHELARHLVIDRAKNRTRFRLLDRSEFALPAEMAAAFLESRRAGLAIWRALIDRGIADGYFRPVDSRVAALSLIGMCNWVAWWFEPGEGHPIEPIATQIADAAVATVAMPVGLDGPPTDADAVIEQIGDHLHRLRQLFADKPAEKLTNLSVHR